MASFNATLEIGGLKKPIKLKKLFMTCFRKRDDKGRPASYTRWSIVVAIDTDVDSTFTQWMVDPHGQKDVTIKYYEVNQQGSVLKQWNIPKAHCFSMREGFVADSSILLTTLVIAGENLSNGHATLPNNWK